MPRPLLFACAALLLLMASAPRRAAGDWPPEGVPLCTLGICNACCPLVCSDGAGGAFVLWREERHGSIDLYLQRVTASGAIAPGWPIDGVPVCVNPATQLYSPQALAPDGLGGVFVTWFDYRGSGPIGTTGTDIYAQRILADGSVAAGWPGDGLPVAVAAGNQEFPVVTSDPAGGAYLTWDDYGTGDVYLQRLTAGGQPAPGWPDGGVPVCTDPSFQGGALVTPDGTGGVFIAWADYRDSPVAQYAARVLPDGSISPGWPVNGARIVLGTYMRGLVPDGAGGAYLASATPGGLFEDDDYFLQRFTGSGAIAPGWAVGGTVVCTAPDTRVNLHMVADGAGGALMTWADYRDFVDDEIFVQRVQPDGTLSPGWPVDGLRVTDNTGFDSGPEAAPDGMGGAYLCWGRLFADGDRVAVQRITGLGAVAPGWPAGGRVIPSESPSFESQITADGAGGAIVVWARPDHTIRALRFNLDGPVPVQVSLASAEATPERVVLRWWGEGAGNLAASVERRSSIGEWESLGRASPEGPDALRYEDRAVIAGTRYAYRLSYSETDGPHWTAESWVDVPSVLRTQLGGFKPNPAVGAPVIAFSLADGSPATLEVLDVTGRRVLTREVASLGAGRHELKVAEGPALAAGVYLIRLHHAGGRQIARGVVVR